MIALGAGDIYLVAGQLSEFLRNTQNRNGAKASLFSKVRGKVLVNEPLSRHTTLKVGGPIEHWIEPEDMEDLKSLLQIASMSKMKVTILGAGSNILAPDDGLKGVAIALSSPYFRQIHMRDGRICARAGVLNSIFIQFAMKQGFGGCEFLLGIPGCIGGALAMNAGSHGQWIEKLVESVTILGLDGSETVLEKSWIPFNYRSFGIQEALILEGVFLLPTVSRETVQRKLDEYRDYRQETQDLRYPSAGCMFKNPEKVGFSSGQLIEEAGLKGLRVGNAQVSLKHANFIVNLGGASSRDICSLIEIVRQAVLQKYNVKLETEVKIL